MNDLTLSLTRKALHSALSRVAPAVSREETRYYLNGVLFAQVDNVVEVVATDGHRLHRVRVYPEIAGKFPARSLIIHNDLVKQVLKLKPGRRAEDESVDLTFTDKQVIVKVGNQVIAGELIEGSYPDYSRVIPGDAVPFFCCFNPEYLMQICSAAVAGGSRQIMVRAQPPTSEGERYSRDPVVTNDETGGTYVLMPMSADRAAINRIDAESV